MWGVRNLRARPVGKLGNPHSERDDLAGLLLEGIRHEREPTAKVRLGKQAQAAGLSSSVPHWVCYSQEQSAHAQVNEWF